MNIAEVRKHRGMPFLKCGMKVYSRHNGLFGKVTGGNQSANINVKFEGRNYTVNCHPHWQMIYYDKNNNVIAEYGK